MPIYDGNLCTVKGTLVWDGITDPEMDTPVGKPKFSAKIVIHPQEADLVDFNALANLELQNGEFKGALPAGANWCLGQVSPTDKFNADGQFNGWLCINAGTYRGAPQVFDMMQNQLTPQSYTSMLYAGAQVELLVNFYSYNNKQKGVAAGLAGVRIIDATTPRLAVGGGYDAGKVWGQAAGAAPVVQPGVAPVAQQQVQQSAQQPIGTVHQMNPAGVPPMGGVPTGVIPQQPIPNAVAIPGTVAQPVASPNIVPGAQPAGVVPAGNGYLQPGQQ